jgi:transposase
MSKKRNRYTPEFKAKVALAALKNDETISELSARFGVHPTMINNWKRALVDGASDIFGKSQKALLFPSIMNKFKGFSCQNNLTGVMKGGK